MAAAKRRFAALLIGLGLAASACTSSSASGSNSTSPLSKVTELHNIGELRTSFNRDAQKVRLILLISPT
jgi:hypothetical protein